jgi:hypothetical protein
MSRTARIVLISVGLLVVLSGLFAWSVEDSYGAGLDYSLMPKDGRIQVFETSSGSEPVFVGTREEANAYMEEQRAARESFVIPGAIIAAGAILVVVGALARRGTEPSQGASTLSPA